MGFSNYLILRILFIIQIIFHHNLYAAIAETIDKKIPFSIRMAERKGDLRG